MALETMTEMLRLAKDNLYGDGDQIKVTLDILKAMVSS